MEISKLASAGLTSNESKVYTALLKLGSTGVEKLSKQANLHRRCVYDALESLNNKGLAGYVTKGKRKLFSASHPNQLLSLMKEKEFNIQEILPELIRIKESANERQDVSIYPGYDGVKLIFDDIIRTGEDNIAISTNVPDNFKDLTMRWHKRRINAKIHDRILFSKSVREWSKRISPKEYTEVRFLPEEYDPKVSINIYGDKVGLIIWQDESTPLCVLVRSGSFAESFRHYFEFMWNQADAN